MAFDESVLQCDNVKCEIGCLKRLLSLLFRNSIPFNVWEVFHLLWRACLSRKLVSWNFEQRRKKPRNLERFFFFSYFGGIGLCTGSLACITDGINVSLTVSDSPLK